MYMLHMRYKDDKHLKASSCFINKDKQDITSNSCGCDSVQLNNKNGYDFGKQFNYHGWQCEINSFAPFRSLGCENIIQIHGKLNRTKDIIFMHLP